MNKIKPSIFTHYHLTASEEAEGRNFTTLQREFLQNELAIAVEKKLEIQPNPENMQSYIQLEAYHRGMMDILLYLLRVSEDTSIAIDEEDSQD